MESFDAQENLSVDDYSEEPFYDSLKKLPRQLALNHIKHIENEAMTDTEAVEYLNDIVESRQEVMLLSEISDKNLALDIAGEEPALFNQLENWTRTNPDNYLGIGTTAKVKSYQIEKGDRTYKLAIKYIVTPNEKTLTAQGEHDVVSEVERLRTIESSQIQHEARSRFIRVPHPYLHYKNDKVQLFGMEKVDGINLQQVQDNYLHKDFLEKLRQSELSTVPMEEVDGYIERFFDTMHEYCLHGDIKPRNIMISSEGVFYIIDFGQSRLAHTIPEEAQEQFDNLKNDEVKMSKLFIKNLIRTVQSKEKIIE